MCLLRECGAAKLLRECGTAKLLRGCPPKDICTEFGLNPLLYLKITWSGTLTRCTDCWDLNSVNHWLCTAAPAALPNITNILQCTGTDGALASNITLVDYLDFCGGEDTFGYTDTSATAYWDCRDGYFELLVVGYESGAPLFYSGGSLVKDGDVLVNQLSCLSFVASPPCIGSLSFPAFVTGGSYKVEIVP